MTVRRPARAALALLALTAAAMLLGPPLTAQQSAAVPPASGIAVGALEVTGATWNFDGGLDAGDQVGSWYQVTVTNTNCASPYNPGTAQAGAIILTARLSSAGSQSGAMVLQGDLLPFTGTKATGHARVSTATSNGDPVTQVDATVWNLESFALNNTLNVCLTGYGPAVVSATLAADTQQVVQMGYDVTGIVTTPGPDGSTFIGISGIKIGIADGYTQWVFFFNGTTYLGTDTGVPSPQLQLVGSPAAGQINVQYTNYAPNDPLCCPSLPPVTITYTWDGTRVTPSGTPPGH
jgi:hypothetical protein